MEDVSWCISNCIAMSNEVHQLDSPEVPERSTRTTWLKRSLLPYSREPYYEPFCASRSVNKYEPPVVNPRCSLHGDVPFDRFEKTRLFADEAVCKEVTPIPRKSEVPKKVRFEIPEATPTCKKEKCACSQLLLCRVGSEFSEEEKKIYKEDDDLALRVPQSPKTTNPDWIDDKFARWKKRFQVLKGNVREGDVIYTKGRWAFALDEESEEGRNLSIEFFPTLRKLPIPAVMVICRELDADFNIWNARYHFRSSVYKCTRIGCYAQIPRGDFQWLKSLLCIAAPEPLYFFETDKGDRHHIEDGIPLSTTQLNDREDLSVAFNVGPMSLRFPINKVTRRDINDLIDSPLSLHHLDDRTELEPLGNHPYRKQSNNQQSVILKSQAWYQQPFSVRVHKKYPGLSRLLFPTNGDIDISSDDSDYNFSTAN